jgi:hypothetical protein
MRLDAVSGNIYFSNADTSIAVAAMQLGQWHLLEVELDFAAGSASGWVDGDLVGQLPLVADASLAEPEAACETLRVTAAGGPAFFDDLRIYRGALP